MSKKTLKIMVLAGGPDRERQVSLESGQQVAQGLVEAGHEVKLCDISPTDLLALDEFDSWQGDALFIAMHGPWGEGGGLQQILDQRQLPYLGCTADVADLCMDKWRTKRILGSRGIATPPYEIIEQGQVCSINGPVVIKPLREGSSIDVVICHEQNETADRIAQLLEVYPRLLVEKFVDGIELTVGIIGGPAGVMALPPVQIVPSTEFYDYEAKYQSDDTEYLFDIDLPVAVLGRVCDMALRAHKLLGCRHLSRVDFMVDELQRPRRDFHLHRLVRLVRVFLAEGAGPRGFPPYCSNSTIARHAVENHTHNCRPKHVHHDTDRYVRRVRDIIPLPETASSLP